MTGVEVVGSPLCGARVRRCRNCENTLGAREDTCAKCKSIDIDEDSTCRRRPLEGQRRCGKHGGKSPAALVKAAERDLEEEALRELARLGQPDPIRHPVEELLALAAEFKARNAFFRDRLTELDSLAAVDAFGVERARAMVEESRKAATDLQRSLEGLVKLDLDARKRKLDLDESRLVWDAVDGGLLAAFGFTPDYQRAREAIGLATRLLMGDPDGADRVDRIAAEVRDQMPSWPPIPRADDTRLETSAEAPVVVVEDTPHSTAVTPEVPGMDENRPEPVSEPSAPGASGSVSNRDDAPGPAGEPLRRSTDLAPRFVGYGTWRTTDPNWRGSSPWWAPETAR